MPIARVERRLAAIMAADIVGYSRLMEADEAQTLAAIRTLRIEVIEPLVAEHRGRVVKLMGDGAIVEFGSVVDAVACAVALQQGIATHQEDASPENRIVFRIGINLGDVVVEGTDLFGDGVNVAARLERLADPGGIYISDTVRKQLVGKTSAAFEDAGERMLKNIAEPVRVFRWAGVTATATPIMLLPLPSKPSIAILPFTNMSNDPEQEHFVDGLTEDLITDLSRNGGLFVIARNSSFAYKGRSVDVRLIARELGVRYLLEGSARRAGGRVRINVQFIDTIGGDHLWAERFDRSLEDIFAVQDEVTGKIVEALVGRLSRPPARTRPKSMEAYDLCVRGRALIGKSPEATREALLLLQRAIALDPGYAEAHRLLAMHLWASWTQWGEAMEPNRALAVATAEKAISLDPNDAGCRLSLGKILVYERRWPESDAQFTAALELDPNHADAWATLSDFSVLSGHPAAAIEQAERALRLNPRPAGWYYWNLGFAQYAARQYGSAVATLSNEATYRTVSRRILAASLAQLGRLDEARQEAELFMASNPLFSIRHWAATQPFRDDATLAHFVDGYRKSGLPE